MAGLALVLASLPARRPSLPAGRLPSKTWLNVLEFLLGRPSGTNASRLPRVLTALGPGFWHSEGGDIKAVGWVNLLSEPRSKLQGLWSSKLRQRLKDRLLRDLSPDDQVDLRTAGGPGAGGFLEAPVLWEDVVPKNMPEKHFLTMLRDRLRLDV